MEDKLLIDGCTYITTSAASRILGYDGDYVARLCRNGKIVGRQFNKRWVVDLDTLNDFIRSHAERKALWQARLSQELKAVPRHVATRPHQPKCTASPFDAERGLCVAPREVWQANEKGTDQDLSKSVQKTQRAPRVLTTIAITSLVIAIGITPIGPQHFAMRAPRAFVAAVNESVASAWFSQTLCTWFSLRCEQKNAIADASRERAYEPVVVYEKSPAPSSSHDEAAPQTPTVSTARTVVERTVERVVEAAPLAGAYVTDALLVTRLSDLENRINQRISSVTLSGGGGGSTINYVGTFGVSQKIDRLDGVGISGGTISGANITGGSLTASSISGVVDIT